MQCVFNPPDLREMAVFCFVSTNNFRKKNEEYPSSFDFSPALFRQYAQIQVVHLYKFFYFKMQLQFLKGVWGHLPIQMLWKGHRPCWHRSHLWWRTLHWYTRQQVSWKLKYDFMLWMSFVSTFIFNLSIIHTRTFLCPRTGNVSHLLK